MPNNPYEPPKEGEPPPDKYRGLRWMGTFLIAVAIVPYVPMTITPFLALAGLFERPLYISPLGLIGAGIFNGLMCAALFFGGRWLRKKGAKEVRT